MVVHLNFFTVYSQTEESTTHNQSELELNVREINANAIGFRQNREYQKSLEFLDSALILISGIAEKRMLQSEVLIEKGLTLMYLNENIRALKVMQEALNQLETLRDSSNLTKCYNYIAALHQIQGNFNTAADYYNLSLPIAEKLGVKTDVGRVTSNLGSLYEDLADYDIALSYHNKSLEIWTELNDSVGKLVSLTHIGLCKRSTGKLRQALVSFQQANEINKKLNSRLNQIYISKQMGLVYLELGKIDSALNWLTISYDLSEEDGFLVDLQESAASLALVNEKLGNFKEALAFHKRSLSLKDSIFSNEKAKEITRLEMSFQFDKEQLADSLEYVRTTLMQENQITKQRYGLVSIGAKTAILLMLAMAIYYGKRKSDNLLLNILPAQVANELKEDGESKAKRLENVTVLFTDFKGFT